MFSRKKKGGNTISDVPNVQDDDDGEWYKPATVKGTSTYQTDISGIGPPPPPSSNFRARDFSSKTSASVSSHSERKPHVRLSAQDIFAAISCKDWDVVSRIVDQTPNVGSETAPLTLKGQKTESNPLHLLVISNPPLDILECVLENYPDAASNTDEAGERTALHWACIANASPAILEIVASANPIACKYQDRKFNRTPLHYLAAIANNADQIHVMMGMDRRVALIKDFNGKTPIDLANDSSNPSKMEIVSALQRKRTSKIAIFGGLRKHKSRNESPGKYKSRTESPGKYKSRTESPGKYKSRTESPGKYKSRTESPGKYKSRSESPGKYKSRPRSPNRPKDAKSRTASSPSRGRRKVSGIDASNGSSRKNRSIRTSDKNAGHVAEGTELTGESVAAPSRVVQSQISGDVAIGPPPSARSIESYELTPPRSTHNNPTDQTPHSPSASRSRSPLRPSSQGSITSVSDTSSIHQTSNSFRSSIRTSIQMGSLAAGMDGEIRELHNKLERSKAVLEEKDAEIDQLNDEIYANKQMEAHLCLTLQGGEASQSSNQRELDEKRDEVQKLKRQIAELQSNLRRAESDVKRIERSVDSSDGGFANVEQQIQDNRDQLNDLRALMEALNQEKLAAKRDVDNIESELKSLETIQMLAHGDNIG